MTAQAYPDHDDEPGVAEHERAVHHRGQALAALAEGDRELALVQMLGAIEARLEEQSAYLARLS